MYGGELYALQPPAARPNRGAPHAGRRAGRGRAEAAAEHGLKDVGESAKAGTRTRAAAIGTRQNNRRRASLTSPTPSPLLSLKLFG